jgi:probable HAF family extracellular repeat protein
MKACLLIALFVLTAGLSAEATPQYTITNLQASRARGINDRGQVICLDNNDSFIWDSTSGKRKLATLPPSFPHSTAMHVNNLGDAAGELSNGYGWTGVIWRRDGSLVQVLPGSENSIVCDINDSGAAAGIRYGTGSQCQAFLYDGSSMTNLPTLGGVWSMAQSINNSGQIAGDATNHQGKDHAVLWNAGQPLDLGTLGGSTSWATGIGDDGRVVGMSESANGYWYGFLWQSGQQMVNLGTLPGYRESDAEAVNSRGEVVGRAMGPGNRAFIWSNGGMYDLNDLIPANSGWVLQSARDINESGQIIGYGTFNGVDEAFLLTPVPEPSSMFVLLCGLGGLGAMLRRRT